MTTLAAADIAVLAGLLLISAAGGIFFAIKDKNSHSTEVYYFGGRSVSPIPVAASISVSFLSALSVISFSVEVYQYGLVNSWDVLAVALSHVVAAVWFVPIYHRLKISTVYEYLELRYNKTIRLATSFMEWLNVLLYLGVVTYMPAIALSATTPLSVHAAIVITGVICTFYTTIGGMKAVIWTDLLQSLMMFGGTLSLFIATVVAVGGVDEFVESVERGGRNNFLKFDIDPRIRSSFWTVTAGFLIARTHDACCSQIYIQRYLACRSERSAKVALLLAIIPDALIVLACVANGLALYAYFEDCDPLLNDELENADQSIPFLALKVFQGIPGMTGVFVSTVYSATLSTVSSGINAMSALILHDFLLPCYPRMKQRMKITISMIMSILIGALVMTLAFIASTVNVSIMLLIYAFVGVISGPTLGLFITAAFMPWVNSKGAICGFVCGAATILCIGSAAYFNSDLAHSPEPNGGKLPLSTDGCIATNSTTTAKRVPLNLSHSFPTTTNSNQAWNLATQSTLSDVTATSGPVSGESPISALLSISPYLYGCIGWMVTMVVANIASLITGRYDPSKTNWKLFAPGVEYLFNRDRKTIVEVDDKTDALRMAMLSESSS